MNQKKEELNTNTSKAHDDNNIDMTHLDALINGVATGQRILFFPPGKLIFIFVMILLPIFPSILLIGECINLLGDKLSTLEGAITQLISIPIIMFFTYGPAFLIAHGKKKYVEVTRYFYRFLLWGSFIFFVYYGVVNSELNIYFMLASIASSFGLWLMKTLNYQLYVEYMYRLKKRKLEIYEEEQRENKK